MNEPETIFYDGHCGLCHRWVTFVLRRDPDGSKFDFGPLQGDHFAAVVPEARRAALPDSMFVLRADGTLLQKSSGPLHILRRLGRGWWVLGTLGWLVPRPLRNLAYDGVATVRRRFFATPGATCPVLPPELRKRFRF